MGNFKIRVIGLVVALVFLVLAVLPGSVQADAPPRCRFTGNIIMSDGSNTPSNVQVKAGIADAPVGPWWEAKITKGGTYTSYVVDIPPDDLSTPAIDGGTEGALIIFRVYVNGYSVIFTDPPAIWHEAANSSPITLKIGAPVVYLGDANGDGLVTVADIIKVERIMAGKDPPTPGADANQDGLINVADIIKIALIMSGNDP
jgi:hypothetical protein